MVARFLLPSNSSSSRAATARCWRMAGGARSFVDQLARAVGWVSRPRSGQSNHNDDDSPAERRRGHSSD